MLTPGEQRETFVFAEPGYRIELVASEPMVQDPVATVFDGEGRLWVVEMRGYMQDIDGSNSKDPTGRISVLEDSDGDGTMDRSTVFAEGLILPRAVAVHPGGVLIAENETLTLHRDSDGDLVSDRRKVIDANYARDDIEHSANGLCRALDNRIYNAKEGHRYEWNGETWTRQPTEERGQWGVCQDDRGRLFYNYNHSQLHADLVPPGSLTRNPNHEPSTGISVGVTVSNQVFPIRPNPAANRAYIPGALDERGRIQEFTSACAPLVYRSSLFPDFAGNAFVCEPVGNLVKRNILSETGVSITGAPAYPDRDFLASTDERFRPVSLSTGPDGALYITDMYRGIVQDSPHMSPYLREISIAREMATPIHKGRIWRIVPKNFEQPAAPHFSELSVADLVETLAHPDGWWRDQAQMHLVEKGLVEAIPALLEMTLQHRDEKARLHALWTLEGLHMPDLSKLTNALNDESPVIRAAAVRVLHSLGLPNAEFASLLDHMIAESLPEEVALQILITAGDLEISEERRFQWMKAILLPRLADPLMRDAALSSLANHETDFLPAILEDAKPGSEVLIESLAQAATTSGSPAQIATLLELLPEPSILKGIQTGVAMHSSPITLPVKPSASQAHPELAEWFEWPGHKIPRSSPSGVRPLKKEERLLFARGRQVYLTSCMGCHGTEGKGTRFLAPPLAGSDWVTGSEERLARILFHGLSGPVTVAGKSYTVPDIQPVMPPLATLDNKDIASVLTYIRREWKNAADPITSGRINKLRIEAQGRTTPWTEEELAPYSGLKNRAN